MKLIDKAALRRGRAIVDQALGESGTEDLGLADYVGIVAAYLARNLPTHEMIVRLTPKLGEFNASYAYSVFEFFDQETWTKGLWYESSTPKETVFNNLALNDFYPTMANRWES